MKSILLLAATLALAVTAVARTGQASAPDTIHYPDLRTLTPSTLSIQPGPPRLLRLSNVIWNAGDGRMELRPQNNAQTQTTDAYQRLYSHDAGGNRYLVGEVRGGAERVRWWGRSWSGRSSSIPPTTTGTSRTSRATSCAT